MTMKNVMEIAHDEYIKSINELLREENPFDEDHNHSSDIDSSKRRGEDLDFLGYYLYISN